MAGPIKIKPWLSIEKMFRWLQAAPDGKAHKRRMALWLTCTGKLNADKVAQVLEVSTQAVWLWIRQYNSSGPAGLERKGRGGRRWGFMTGEQEKEILAPFIRKIQGGEQVKPAVIKKVVEQKLGRKVSVPYIYRLLSRHGWGEMIAQSRYSREPLIPVDDFERAFQPWRRTE